MTTEDLNKRIEYLLPVELPNGVADEVKQLLTDFLEACLPEKARGDYSYKEGWEDAIDQIKSNAEMLLRGETE